MTRRTYLNMVCIILATIFVSAPWATQAAATCSADARGVLRFGVHVSGMGKLDPHFAAASQDRAVADMVFNGLLRYVPGNAPRIEPDLAVRIPEFKMIGGRQVWTVQLRKGVRFHPGPDTPAYELTADDVVFSLTKSADSTLSAYAGEYTGMEVNKIDSYTVQITLAAPLSPTLFFPKIANYAGGFIVSKRAFDAMGYDRFKSHPVGTGPFIFRSYTPGNTLVLTANPDYFRGRPRLAGVEMHFMPDIAQRESALIAGELDVITASGEKGWIERIEHNPDIVVDAHGVGEVAMIYFNVRMPPFDDIRVRRAVALAVNRQAFMNITSNRIAGSVYSPVPADFLPGGLSESEIAQIGLHLTQDIDQARQLLVDAGYPDGFTIDLVTSEKRLYRSDYDTLCAQLADIGVHCNLTELSHAEMHKHIRQVPMPMVIYVAWRPNADVYLTRFFHSDSIVVSGARPDTNFSHYDKIDALIEAARLEINPDKQIHLWKQAQIRILHDMAAYPIMYSNQAYARRRCVNYGHALASTMALYPQFTEMTHFQMAP